MADFVQYLLSGMTVGAIYALVALGFTIIYNASEVVNFAQGEFVMLGGMTTFFLNKSGVPLPAAALLAILITTLVGLVVYGAAMERAAAGGLGAFFAVILLGLGVGLPTWLAAAIAVLAAAAAALMVRRLGSRSPWLRERLFQKLQSDHECQRIITPS